MEKVKLTYVRSEEKTSKGGKNYTSVGIKIESKPDTCINGFGNAQTANWQEGDEFELDIFEEEYNGKMYWKFKLPKTGEALVDLTKRVECLEETVNALLKAVPNAVVAVRQDNKYNRYAVTGRRKEIPIPSDDDLPF